MTVLLVDVGPKGSHSGGHTNLYAAAVSWSRGRDGCAVDRPWFAARRASGAETRAVDRWQVASPRYLGWVAGLGRSGNSGRLVV